MKSRYLIIAALLIAVFGAGGWWLAQRGEPHRHILEQRETPEGEVYWTCPMHPEVRQDRPGNCPICGMRLIKREEPALVSQEGGEKRVLYWYDPMRPDVQFDAPGKSPFMDMDLVPKYADEGNDAGIVRIDPRMAQNLGIRTTAVTRGTVAQRVDAVGAVEVDERLIFAVESRAAGWVERLHVRAEGDPVRRGQVVAGVYSPELYSAQEELVLAAQSGDAGLIAATRQRLALQGMSESQIREVLDSGRAQRQTRIAAPSSGVVTELNVREGQQVGPGMPLMRIADLSRVWITVEIPESLSAAVRIGMPATARLGALPGRHFEGTMDYVYPKLEAVTRTVRARLVFDNRDGALKPGMFANVGIDAGAQLDVLRVPSEAVIRTGRRTVVIVAEGEGRFRPVPVELGPEQDGQIAILSGLAEGQRVVTSGQFLIDSEASLQGAYQRFEEGEGARHEHD
jgi:membrane fusion protein, copper/silver efflux system